MIGLSRRTVLLLTFPLPATALLRGTEARSQIIAVVTAIDAVANLLGKVAESLSKFGDSIAHLVTISTHGIDALSARKIFRSMRVLRIELVQLSTFQRSFIVADINDFIKKSSDPSRDALVIKSEWDRIKSFISTAVKNTDKIKNILKELGGNFVLEKAYQSLVQALNDRSVILNRLDKIDPPTAPKELQALAKMSAAYEAVISATNTASDQLAGYMKKQNISEP